jgi:Tfp pilus assembly protein PilO
MTNPFERFQLSLGAMQKEKEIAVWFLKYAAVFILFLFFFIPVQSRVSSHMSEVSSMKKQIGDLKQITTSLLTPEEIERVKGRVDRFESKLADPTKMPAILDEITKFVEVHHLRMIQIYSDSPVLVKNEQGKEMELNGKKLHRLPVTFRVEADLKSLAAFLRDVREDSQWINTAESVSIQASSGEGEALVGDITLSYIAV